ncbi:MAG: SIMPL domain-containing protein [Mycobacterium sp.]
MAIAGSPLLIRLFLAPTIAGAIIGTVSACDSTAAAGGNPRQVTVIGSGQVQGVPDTLIADVGIEVVASDVTTAMNQTSDRQQTVITALMDAGVDRNDISTMDISLQPEYADSTGTPSFTPGYRADNTIRVKVAQDSASRALAVIVKAGGDATRINSVSYSIEDDSQLVRAARERAFNDAKDRAEQYAELSGLRLGRVISISEQPGGIAPIPTPMPRSTMAAPVPVEPGQQTVVFSVTAVWELA